MNSRRQQRTRTHLSALPRAGKAIQRSGLRFALGAGIAVAAIVASLVFGVQIRNATEDLVAEQLEALVATDAKAISLWFEHQHDRIALLARDASILNLANSLDLTGGVGTAAEERFEQELDTRSWIISDGAGSVVAASEASWVGAELSNEAIALATTARQSGARVGSPSQASPIAGLQNRAHLFILAAAPIATSPLTTANPTSSAGSAAAGSAVLLIELDPRNSLQSLLDAAGIGRTGETYAINGDGWAITPTRLSGQLEGSESTVILDDAGQVATFLVADPTPRADRNEPSPSGSKLTLAAASLKSASQNGDSKDEANGARFGSDFGSDARGYRDYRGVMVLGAWRWLDELGIGLITEIDRDEALLSLRPLRRAFLALVGLMFLLGAWSVWSRFRIRKLEQRVEGLRQLGQYELLEKIGEGGMGSVYRARHALLKRPAAVKRLHPEQVDEETSLRFEREARMTSLLTHPNTIAIYDYGCTAQGIFYYAMELLDGMSLAEILSEHGAVDQRRAVHVLRQASGSLEEAHGLDLVHRDIKPGNIMLVCQGGLRDQVKVLDFGLVREMHPDDPGLTQQGIVAGTPAYIPPERLRDPSAVDARGDIYALGCVAYDMLVGQPAYQGSSSIEIATHVLSEPTPRVSEKVPGVDPALEELIYRCMAKDPEERPATMSELERLLEALELPPWTETDATVWWSSIGQSPNPDNNRSPLAGAQG